MKAGFGEGEGGPAPDGEAESGLLEVPVEGNESPPPEEEESQPAAADPVIEALARIEDKLAESQRLVDRQTEVAARLHTENQTLRAGELRTAQVGLVSSVLRVYDDVSRMAVTSEEPSTRRDLGMIAEALVDALAGNGIDLVSAEEGERFEPGRHKVAEVEPTLDADADRTIARVVRPGFAWSDGTVVRVSDVVVLRYEAPAADAASDDIAD